MFCSHCAQSCLTSASCLPFDIQRATGNMYQHFEMYAVRVRTLKSFCDLTETKCKATLGHSKTMWLALTPAVGRTQMFLLPWKPTSFPLKSVLLTVQITWESPYNYHLSCPCQSTKNFFSAIRNIEKHIKSVLEVKSEIHKLLLKQSTENSSDVLRKISWKNYWKKVKWTVKNLKATVIIFTRLR